MLNAERQSLESNKPHKVYEDLVATADPFTTSSQSEESRNLKQIQNGKYLIQKKTKANEKVNINRFSFLVFLLLEGMVFLDKSFTKFTRFKSIAKSDATY